MKKIVFVLLMAVMFGGCKPLLQRNYIIINYGGTSIKIPSPGSTYKDIHNDKILFPEHNNPSHDNNLCFFIDVTDKMDITNKDSTKLTFKKYLIIQHDKLLESQDIKDYKFNMIKNVFIEKLKQDIHQLGDSTSKLFYNFDEIYTDIDFSKTKTISCVYNLKDIDGFIILSIVKSEPNEPHNLHTMNFLKIKNKLFTFKVFSIYNGKEDIKWIAELSESWAKAILEANK